MAGPWEQYQSTDSPWLQYQETPAPAAAPAAKTYSPRNDPVFQAGRFAGTVGPRAVAGIVDFAADPMAGIRSTLGTLITGDARLGSLDQPGPGTRLLNRLNQATGFEETQPQGSLGRVGMSTAQGAATGTAFGPVGTVIGGASGLLGSLAKELTGSDRAEAAAGLLPGLVAGGRAAQRRPLPPSAVELQGAAGRGYDAARASGVAYEPQAAANFSTGLRNDLYQAGFDENTAPKTHRVLDALANPPGAGPGATVTIQFPQMHGVRKTLGNIANDTDAGRRTSDAVAASRAVREIDGFIENPGAMGLASGSLADTAAVAQTLREANRNYSAALRSDDLTGTLARGDRGILDRAETDAASANSGSNLDNRVRAGARALLRREERLAPWSDAEVEALRGIAEGSLPRNAARRVGNILGGGGGLGSVATTGVGAGLGSSFGHFGAAIGATVPLLTGMALKGIENSLTRRDMLALDAMTRRRSPLYEQQQANAPPLQRQMEIARGLLPAILGDPRDRGR